MKKITILAIILFCALTFGQNHPILPEFGESDNIDPRLLDVEAVVCSVGAVHNLITNSTNVWATDQHTIIIGDYSQQQPSMIWTVPEEYADSNHYLSYGSLRLGYDNKLVRLWSETSPGIDTLKPPYSFSDFDTHFYISDQYFLNPPILQIGIGVHQYTYAWRDSSADDFIIYDYWIVNLDSVAALDYFYVAFHADCDVSRAGGSNCSDDDMVSYYRNDQTREYISYMYDGDDPNTPEDDEGGYNDLKESAGYIGSRLLYCPANLYGDPEGIQTGHHWLDYSPSSDQDWYELMSDRQWLSSDPDSVLDYSYLQKTGPFTIPANDTIRVVFAFGIGEGLDNLRVNLEAARLKFYGAEEYVSVWPGDLDNNGTVEAEDILPLAAYWYETGFFRGIDYAWEAHDAPAWSNLPATYADADGSGRVDIRDILPICLNWGLTHDVELPGGLFVDDFDIEANRETLKLIYGQVINAQTGPQYEIKRFLEKILDISLPDNYFLYQNYPNPFNSSTVIKYKLPERSDVRITVYNISGQIVKVLADDILEAGDHEVVWNSIDESGRKVSSGLYFYSLDTVDNTQVKMMTIVK